MKELNLVEILKDCPKGMELDCTMFENVTFNGISNERTIVATRGNVNRKLYLNKYGQPLEHPKEDLKCIIFPKGKTTWEGFVPPCQFEDGDILSNGICICIYNGNESKNYYGLYVGVGHIDYPDYFIVRTQNSYFSKQNAHLATEEEKQKLFQAIKDNGYKWNADKKKLEKLIEPKFKVGDRVREKGDQSATFTISDIDDSCYYCGEYVICNVCDQDNYELVPNKFDISTLKPFDKVLVRDNNEQQWTCDFFSHYRANDVFKFISVGHYTSQCILYEENKHLLGTTDDCDEYYKTWED